MPLKSDLALDVTKFESRAISEKTVRLNASIIDATKGIPKWWEVGAPRYREMRLKGETAFPAPVILPSGSEMYIPSRAEGRDIRLRVHKPETGSPVGVFLHIHGGGWVLQDENGQDSLLKFIADEVRLVVVSVGYRLAPENPFPAGPQDCFDAAEWLVDNAKDHFGAELQFLGGESAGGHLSALTCFYLIESRPSFEFKGLLLMYGVYDTTQFLPQAHNFKMPLVLTIEIMQHFVDAFLPNSSINERRNPKISPFYADLSALAAKTPSGKLPPAFFSCGTYDCLLDDSVMMSTKWLMTGSDTLLKIYPGAPHGFTLFPPDISEASGEYRGHLAEFMTRYTQAGVNA